MYKALLVLAILFSVGWCQGLVSWADSDDFAMDTIDPQVQILYPVGGEEWFINTPQNILWAAQDHSFSDTPISLWYSTNSGADYQMIQENLANSGTYVWQISAVQTDHAKVRIMTVDSFGNAGEVSSPQTFSIIHLPPAAPENLVVDTANGLHALLSWDAVTQTIPPYNLPFSPDGYIILYNETPAEDEQSYYFLGRSYINSFAHLDVVEFRNQMFYMVKAYKNYSRAEAEALEALLQSSKTQRITWDAAKALLNQGSQK